MPATPAGRADLSVPVRIALAGLRCYKIVLSPFFSGSCRFLPSCADYAADALREHGLLRGTWLAAGRLSRCHPLCASGYDPVPARRPLTTGLDRTAH